MASAPASAAASTRARARSREPLWLPDISATMYGRLSVPNLVIFTSLRHHDGLHDAVDGAFVSTDFPEAEAPVQCQDLFVLLEGLAVEPLQAERAEGVLDGLFLQAHPGRQHPPTEPGHVEVERPGFPVED